MLGRQATAAKVELDRANAHIPELHSTVVGLGAERLSPELGLPQREARKALFNKQEEVKRLKIELKKAHFQDLIAEALTSLEAFKRARYFSRQVPNDFLDSLMGSYRRRDEEEVIATERALLGV